jgi:hypothetical protein
MQKRAILSKLPNEPKIEAEPPKEEIKESEIFKRPKTPPNPPEEEPEIDHLIDIPVAIEPPEPIHEEPKKGKLGKRVASDAVKANLAKAREKSIESRKLVALRREAAKIEEEEKINILKMEIRRKNDDKLRMEENELPAPKTTAISASKSSYGEIDYDRIVSGVYSRFEDSQEKFKQEKKRTQLEEDIRADERNKAKKDYDELLKKYESDQHRKYNRETSFNMLSGRKTNSVFERTRQFQEMRKSRM